MRSTQPSARHGRRAPSAVVAAALLAAALCPPIATAQSTEGVPLRPSATLAVGAPAPPLAPLEPLAGAPVQALATGRVHLVLFWAPWSGASTQALARLADLHRRHGERGLDVLAVCAADERGSTRSEARERVHELRSSATFPIAFDARGALRASWLVPAGSPPLPAAFLIDRAGRTVCAGGLAECEARLGAVLAGTHDLAAVAQEVGQRAELRVETLRLRREYDAACRAEAWPRAVRACDELLALDRPGHARFAVAKFQILLVRTGRTDEALEYGRALADGVAADDVGMLNILAWTLVDPHLGLPRTDLALAGRCAQRAVDLTLRRNAVLLDTLARVHAAQGELARAIEIETEAARLDRHFEGTLSDYRARAGQP